MIEDKKLIFDTEKHPAVLMKEFESYISKKLAPTSVYVYMNAIKKFFSYNYKIDSIENYHKFLYDHTRKNRSSHYYDIIIKFIKWINISKETKKKILDIIKDFGKKEYVPKKKTLILTAKERWQIIQEIKEYKHKLIAWIQNETGVRAGDVIRLKRGNINYVTYKDKVVMQINFTQKGDKDRKINIFNKKLTNELKFFIRNVFLDKEFYFLEKKYSRSEELYKIQKRNYNLYYYDLQQACIKLGYNYKEFSTHDIRRNWSNDVWENVLGRKDIVSLQKAMGHKDINTTIRYLRHSGLDSQDIFEKVSNINN